eukprot:2714381-Rhodomonas_salina.2
MPFPPKWLNSGWGADRVERVEVEGGGGTLCARCRACGQHRTLLSARARAIRWGSTAPCRAYKRTIR